MLAKPLLSRDGSEAIVPAYARATVSEHAWSLAAERVARELRPMPGVAVGGPAIAITQVNDQVEHDLTHAEELAFPLLFLLALWVFRSLVAALLPLVCGALTILGSLLMLRVLNAVSPVSSYALNIVTGAGLGLGSTTASCSSRAFARSSRGAARAPKRCGRRSRPRAGRLRTAP